MKILFSPSNCAFYVAEWKNDYLAANNWPADLIAITESEYNNFKQQPPDGKILGSKNGSPAWVAKPPLTLDELLVRLEGARTQYLTEAKDKISVWQTKLLMGRIGDGEKAKLNAWLDYIDSLESLNIDKAEGIIWPVPPEA